MLILDRYSLLMDDAGVDLAAHLQRFELLWVRRAAMFAYDETTAAFLPAAEGGPRAEVAIGNLVPRSPYKYHLERGGYKVAVFGMSVIRSSTLAASVSSALRSDGIVNAEKFTPPMVVSNSAAVASRSLSIAKAVAGSETAKRRPPSLAVVKRPGNELTPKSWTVKL